MQQANPETKRQDQVNWVRLIVAFVVFIILSLGITFVIHYFLKGARFPVHGFGPLAYLTIFGIALVVNISFMPLPFAVAIMIAAAATWNPILIALSGSLGACIGELSGYYVGFISKKVAIPDNLPGYNLMQGWIRRYGLWAVAFLSFQPVLPMEIGGIVAGLAKMPVHKFLLALWVGKLPKYLILIFAGVWLIHLMPFMG